MTTLFAEVTPLEDPEAAFGARDILAPRLGEWGYVSAEFILRGTSGGENFATRLLVRRPLDVESASGVCVVEPMHFGGGRSFWGHAYEQLVRGGHVWVEVACQTHPLRTALVPSNPSRYEELHLPGSVSALRPEIGHGADTRAASQAFSAEWWRTSPQMFGILNAALAAVRSGAIPGVSPKVTVLAGASQSGGIVRRYGELIAQSAIDVHADALLPLHSGGAALPTDLPVPTLELLAEAEIESVRSAAGLPGQARDLAHRACTSPRYRFVEVPGMAHNDSRYQIPSVDPVPGARWSRFPHTHIVHATLERLIGWTGGAQPAPASIALAATDAGDLIRDELGHPRGGLRTPAVDHPTARIRVISPGTFWNRGHEFPLTADELRARYGTWQKYYDSAEVSLQAMIARGDYLAADAERWLREVHEGVKEFS